MGNKPKIWKDCKSMDDVIQYALAHGATEVRTSASHKIFRGPNGRTFPIQFNHPAWDIVPGMKAKLKREMLAAGISIE